MDTGAGGTEFTEGFARAAKLQAEGSTKVIGVTGVSNVASYRVDKLEVGGATLGPLTVYGNLYQTGEKIDGIIGFDLLAGAVVDIDPKQQRMTIFDPSQATADSSKGLTVAADLTSGIAVIPVQLDGVPIHLMIDSGANVSIIQSRLQGNGRNKVSIPRPAMP